MSTPSQATIAVTNWFGSTRSLLNQLDNPLAEALGNTLTEVQRMLFSPAPTVKPVQYTSWNPGDPILGALKYVQPGGAAVSMQLSQAPALGIVQLLSNGSYTYNPGADFTGTDTFTVQVTSAGFNILEPFTPRTSTVTVGINPTPLVSVSRGFNLTNLSGQAVYLAEIQKEAGYEDSLEIAPPIGWVLRPGESAHFETTYWYFYTYETRAIWKTCTDTSCATVTPGSQQWKVRLHTWSGQFWDVNGPTTMNCETGSCSYDNDGAVISNPLGDVGANRAFLLDSPGTVRTLSAGTDADRVARVLEGLCNQNSSATCVFKPANFALTQTDWKFATPALQNASSSESTLTLTRNQTESTQTSLKVAENAKLSLFKIVEAGVTSEATNTWTTSQSYQYAVGIKVQPGEWGVLKVKDPIKQVTGDFTATIGNTTWNLKGVNFETPDPDPSRTLDQGQPVYQAFTAPLKPTTL